MANGRIPYHWTAELEARFLDALIETGSVRLAARAVSMSAKSAYARRNASPDFARRWRETLCNARENLLDTCLAAAFEGVQTRAVRSARNGRLGWHVVDPRLGRGRGLAQLNRLEAALERAGGKAVSSLPLAENRHFPKAEKRA